MRSRAKYHSSTIEAEELGRKPVRFASKHNENYYPPGSTYPRKSTVAFQDTSNKVRGSRFVDNKYVIRRQRVPPDYINDHYYAVSDEL